MMYDTPHNGVSHLRSPGFKVYDVGQRGTKGCVEENIRECCALRRNEVFKISRMCY